MKTHSEIAKDCIAAEPREDEHGLIQFVMSREHTEQNIRAALGNISKEKDERIKELEKNIPLNFDEQMSLLKLSDRIKALTKGLEEAKEALNVAYHAIRASASSRSQLSLSGPEDLNLKRGHDACEKAINSINQLLGKEGV